MNEITVTIAGEARTAKLPKTWNECDKQQALNAYNILHAPMSKVFQREELLPVKKITLLCVLFKSQELGNIIDFDFFKQRQEQLCEEHGNEDGWTIFTSEMNEMMSCLDGFFHTEEDEEGNQLVSIAKDFLTFPIPYITQQRTLLPEKPKKRFKYGFSRKSKTRNTQYATRLYAPSDYFATSTFLELKAAFEYYEAYTTEPSERTQNELIAALFRPKAKSERIEDYDPRYRGQIRVPFSGYEKHIRPVADDMKMIDAGTRQLIVFWIACTLNWVAASYPDLFPKRSEGDAHDPAAWGKLMIALSDSPKLQDLEGVANMPWMNAFEHIRQKNKQAKELEKNYQQINRL